MKSSLDLFLTEFFAPPNQLTTETIANNERLAVFRGFISDLRETKTSFAVLPCWRGSHLVDYYAFAFGDKEFRQLGLDLEAFVGCSYSNFSRSVATLNATDAVERAVHNFSSGLVYKFTGDSGDSQGSQRIAQKLFLMRSLSTQRQRRTPRRRLPLHMLLRDLYMSLEAESRTRAERILDEIRFDGLLDAVNILFLRSLIVCRFGALRELELSGHLNDLLALRRPVAVTEAVVGLLYREKFATFENANDAPGAIAFLKTNILPVYSDLLRTCQGMRSVNAAKQFMLVAGVADPPNQQLRDAILARATEFVPKDVEWLKTIAAAAFPVQAQMPVAAPAGIDALFEAALRQPASVENVRTLCRLAAFADTLEIRRVIQTKYYELDEAEQRALKNTPVATAVLDEYLHSAADDRSLPVPQSWAEWLESLSKKNPWPKAVELARRGASEWRVIDGNTDSDAVNHLLLAVQDRSELRTALPHLVSSARADALWPRPEWRGFYETVMDILAGYTEGTLSDLIVWSELVDVLLSLGVSSDRYSRLCGDANDLWVTHASPANLDWIIDLLDTFLFYPCPDQGKRLTLFLSVANRAHGFIRLLDSSQVAFLQSLSSEFNQPDWSNTFSTDRFTDSDLDQNLFASLSGKMIAIYTLTERVGARAKRLLEILCPTIDVRINSDHVGTSVLRSLARDAEVFIVNTASAKHAATDFIAANRQASLPTLFHNARGSHSMLNLLEQYLISH